MKNQEKLRYILVLWGQSFEEDIGIISVVESRKLGLPTKLVGVGGKNSAGIYGVNLQTDISIEQALQLVNKIFCIIIPCGTAGIRRMGNDPRLHKLFFNACADKAKILVKESVEADVDTLKLLQPYIELIKYYPDKKSFYTKIHTMLCSHT